MELAGLYQEVILDHYKRPKNKALRPNPMVQVHHVNTSSVDEMTRNLSMKNAKISDLSWEGVGCSISQASASVMSELLLEKSREEALDLLGEFQEMLQSKGLISGNEDRLQDGVAFAGVAKFPARVKCALLAWMAFKDAVSRIEDNDE